MIRSGLVTAVVGAVMAVGCLGSATASPAAPSVLALSVQSPVELASFWARPYPFGYRYTPGQCYIHVQEDTPRGPVWKRIWVCTEPGGRGYGEGGHF
jgi:hypothetical protein